MKKKYIFEYLGDKYKFSGFSNRKAPTLSILVTTYNRKKILQRCLNKIFRQTFKDYEIVVFDDFSSDGTNIYLEKKAAEKRISYVQCLQNVAGRKGDRHLINLFLKKFCRGEHFVYLCDDDYWIDSRLLEEQISLMRKHTNASMVIGSQLSCSLTNLTDNGPNITEHNIRKFIDKKNKILDDRLYFFSNLYPHFMSSDEFMKLNNENTVHKNIITGATIYRKKLFLESKTLQSIEASKWQAGWELRNGPGAFGDVIYIDKPCIYVEHRPTNASFTKTQLIHFKDTILSLRLSFNEALKSSFPAGRYFYLKKQKRAGILSVIRSYLRQSIHIRTENFTTMCSDENLATPVKPKDVLKVLVSNKIRPDFPDIWLILVCALNNRLLGYYMDKTDAAGNIIQRLMYRLIWGYYPWGWK